MTDREMLELAAKSMGFKFRTLGENYFGELNRNRVLILVEEDQQGCAFAIVGNWMPLDDLAEAMRIAIKLGIEVSYQHDVNQALAVVHGQSRGRGEFWESGEPEAATCRAIVRAAAAIQQAREAQ